MTEYADLLHPDKIAVEGVEFAISSIPCTVAQSIWVDINKDYKENPLVPMAFTQLPNAIIERILAYAAVNDARDGWVTLGSIDKIDKYVPSPSALTQIVLAMCKRNYGFFFDGSLYLWLGLLVGNQATHSE